MAVPAERQVQDNEVEDPVDGIEIAFAVIVGITLAATPLVAIALVSLASVREDAAHSLFGRCPGRLQHLARRLLGFRAEARAGSGAGAGAGAGAEAGTGLGDRIPPQTRSAPAGRSEVRFAHARRPLPDSGKLPASR
ncbi:MAG: hypothetical protein ACYCVZ_09420 [Streptosporangiaceae bacterium]